MNRIITFNYHKEMEKIQKEWKPENNGVSRIFQFAGFRPAISFILEVADYAEKVDHHPTITNTY